MQPTLYTIGYEGSTPDEFVAALKAAGVAVLLDIRDVAYSRKPGFSKGPLSAHLLDNGIGYVHLKGLGNPPAGRAAGKAGNHDLYHAIFTAHLDSASAQADMAQAAGIAVERPSCLMCFELRPNQCHRNIVAPRLAALTHQTIRHLFAEKDTVQLSFLP